MSARNQSSDPKDGQEVYVDEKTIGTDGEPTIIRYQKGKLLGKGGFAKCYEFT